MKNVFILMAVALVTLMFATASMACNCEVTSSSGNQIKLVKISTGDPIVEFPIFESESGLPLIPVLNPITYHQEDVDFDAYYSKYEHNGVCDLWPDTE